MKKIFYGIFILLVFFVNYSSISALTCHFSVETKDLSYANKTVIVNIKFVVNPSALNGINLDDYDFNDFGADIPMEVYDALDEAVKIYCDNCQSSSEEDADGYHLVPGDHLTVSESEEVINFAQYSASENYMLYDKFAFKSRYIKYSNNGTTCPNIKFSDFGGKKYIYFVEDATDGPDDFVTGGESGKPSVNQPTDDMVIQGFDFCQNSNVLKVFKVFGYIIFVAKILIPLLLIIFGSVDFAKAIISSDDKMIKDAGMSLAKRFIAGIIVFFIPTILNFLLSLVYNIDDVRTKFSSCTTCLLEPNSCETGE